VCTYASSARIRIVLTKLPENDKILKNAILPSNRLTDRGGSTIPCHPARGMEV
jgi:hypothetical protein